MERSCHLNDDIVWDDPHSDVVWDDNGQADKARALVHGGQESFFPNMATAAGKALVELARKGMNLSENFAPDSLIHKVVPQSVQDFASPEAIKNAEIADKPAFDAPGGRFGQIVANTAGTMPIGGPIEAGIARLGAGPLARSLLARTLTSQPVRSGVSGAVNAALTSDPGQRLEAAGEGGALGTVLGGTQSALGRTMSGIVKKSDPLVRLEGDVARTNAIPNAPQRDLFVPVSQGYDPGDPASSIVGKFYRTALPYVPGVESQLVNQSEKAGNVVRGAMLQQGAPEGYVVPANATNDMQLSTKAVKDSYDNIYGALRNVKNITAPKDFATELKTRIMAADNQIPESEVDAYVKQLHDKLGVYAENNAGKSVSGWNLKNLRDDAQAMNSSLPMRNRAGMTDTTKSYIDDIFGKKYQQAFNMGNQPALEALSSYKINAPNYENFSPLQRAVKAARANSGDFTFGKVAPKANDFTDIQGLDQDAKEVLGQRAAQISQAGRISGYGITGALSVLGHAPAVAAIGLGANGMATKSFQKGLYGDTALQQTMKTLLATNPKLAASLGYTLRDAATADMGEQN